MKDLPCAIEVAPLHSFRPVLFSLLTLVLLVVSPALNGVTFAQQHTDVSLNNHATTSALTMPPLRDLYRLDSIKVYPLPESMRVMFRFDQTVPPFSLDLQAEEQWLHVQLVQTEVGFIPSELMRLRDRRLSGIWLKRKDPGLAILELRLPSSNTRLEYFSLEDPPRLVIDLFRTDQRWASLHGGEPIEGKLRSEAQALGQTQLTPGGAALPSSWLDDAASPEDDGDQETEVATAAEEETTMTHEETPPNEIEAIEFQPLGTPEEELSSLNYTYDHFPMHLIAIRTEAGQEVLDYFRAQQWGSVIEKGLDYLTEQSVNNGETPYVLYLIAEARYKIFERNGTDQRDAANFYLQALRFQSMGDLGAYANFRLAQIYEDMRNYTVAKAHAELAEASRDPQIQYQALVTRMRMAMELNDDREFTALEDKLLAASPTTDDLVDNYLLIGQMRHISGDAEGAWEMFLKATEINPNWQTLSPEATEAAAYAAYDLEKYDNAQYLINFIFNYYPNMDDEQTVKLTMFLAEVLAKRGDYDQAETIYATLLSSYPGKQGQTNALVQKMIDRYPDELSQAEERYAKLLMRKGKIRKAMLELDRAYNQSIREGIDPSPLMPLFDQIVPAFMRTAMRNDYPFDAAEAWNRYNQSIRNPAVRHQCLSELIEALEALGLEVEALEGTEQLLQRVGQENVPPENTLLLRKGRLLHKLRRFKEAIAVLEPLVDAPITQPMLAEVYELLGSSYEHLDRDLEAAQMYQAKGDLSVLDSDELGEAWLRAAQIFLEQGQARQCRELCLKAMIHERDMLATWGHGWQNEMGSWFASLLADSFVEEADYPRAEIMLRAYLEREGLADADRMLAQLKLANVLYHLNKKTEARELYGQLASTDEGNKILQQLSQYNANIMDWNEEHPYWEIKLTGENRE